jgi:hypothetical protein
MRFTKNSGGFNPSHTAAIRKIYCGNDSQGLITGTATSLNSEVAVKRIFRILLVKAPIIKVRRKIVVNNITI